jgi:hypothetical protein
VKRTILIFFFTCFATVAGDWPQWLGPTRNNHVSTDEKIPEKLPTDLKPIWKIQIGGGFSSPIVANNKVIYLDENGEKEIVHLLDAKTGKEIWQTIVTPMNGARVRAARRSLIMSWSRLDTANCLRRQQTSPFPKWSADASMFNPATVSSAV